MSTAVEGILKYFNIVNLQSNAFFFNLVSLVLILIEKTISEMYPPQNCFDILASILCLMLNFFFFVGCFNRFIYLLFKYKVFTEHAISF